MWRFLAFKVAEFLLARLPRPAGYLVAYVVAEIVYVLSPSMRASIADNLKHVLGQAHGRGISRAVKSVMRNSGKNYFDLISLPYVRLDKLEKLVTVEGWHNLEEALQKGRGVVLATAHLGSFDVGVQILAMRSVKTTVLVEPLEPAPLFKHVLSLRASKGLTFLPVQMGVLKDILQLLRRGETVLITCDRVFGDGGVNVPFFGSETMMPSGAVRIAMRTGAALVPAYSVRCDGAYKVYIEPALNFNPGGTQALICAMKQVIEVMEKYIRRYPEQWSVVNRVWPPSSGIQPSREIGVRSHGLGKRAQTSQS
ncbi:MAG: hypothetical protein IBX68_08740 [Dehalococcoidia bacterium]|nr:hypothetical protein [Dehalococcoidia bacterium]